MRQGLAKARPRFCVSNLGHYYYVPAESGAVRIKDVSQATFECVYEVERPQLCSVKKTQSSRGRVEAIDSQFTKMDALETKQSVPEVDRDYWGYQSYEASPPDGDARLAKVAPAASFSSVPHVALPNNDGDAIKTICRIVGFPDRKDPE